MLWYCYWLIQLLINTTVKLLLINTVVILLLINTAVLLCLINTAVLLLQADSVTDQYYCEIDTD